MESLRLELSAINHLKDIYSDDYIKRAFLQDNQDFKPVAHPLVKYYSCFYNDEFMGCFMHIKYSLNEIEAHCFLKKKAIKKSRDFVRLFIKNSFSEPSVTRITAIVPEDLKSAINCFKKCGLKIEGIKRDSTFKNGKLLDDIILGITKGDYNE